MIVNYVIYQLNALMQLILNPLNHGVLFINVLIAVVV